MGDDQSRSIALQSDGKIVVTGYSHNGTNTDFLVVRYDSDGSLDATFGTGGVVTTDLGSGHDYAESVVVQQDGKIVVGGHSWNGSNYDATLVRYNSDGTLDATFDGDGIVTTNVDASDDRVGEIILQPDGKIVTVGTSHNGSSNEIVVMRYDTDGSLDAAFGTAGIVRTDVGANHDYGRGVAVQSDGKIVIAGYRDNGPDDEFVVARYNADGSLDTSFDGDGIATLDFGAGFDRAHSVAVQPDGRILVAGSTHNGTHWVSTVVRYDADGTLDTSFDGDGIATASVGANDAFASAITLQADGTILVAGSSSTGTSDEMMVTRYNADGSLDTQFSLVTTLDGAPTFTEGAPAVVLDADVDVSDTELDALNAGLGNYAGASLTVVRTGGASAEDLLSFNDGAGITLVGGNLIKNGQVIASFDTTTTAGQLAIAFTDANGEIPTSADVDAILRQLTYANASDAPPANVTLAWTFDDGNTGAQGSGGALQALGSTTVTITPVNDPPVLDLDADDSAAAGLNFATTWTEGGGPVAVADTDATLSDVDSANLTQLQVQITSRPDGVAELLAADTTGTSIVSSWDSATGILTLSGSDSVRQLPAGAPHDHLRQTRRT